MLGKKFILTMLLLTALIGTASAGTYTVSPTGSGADYSLSEAKAYADSHLNEQITFQLQNGNYGTFYIDDAVQRAGWDKSVTFKAGPGAEPTFDFLQVKGHSSLDTVNRYMVFEGISVIYSGNNTYSAMILIKDSSYIKVIDCTVHGNFDRGEDGRAAAGTSYGLYIDSTRVSSHYATDVLIQGCDIQGAEGGIGMSHDLRDNIVIRGNHVHKINGSIIGTDLPYRRNSEVIIEYNHLHDRRKSLGGTDGSHGSGISVRSMNTTIRGNIIHDFGGSGGIRFYGVAGGHENMIVENNLIYDSQGTTNQVFLDLKENITIRNNTFIGMYGSSSGAMRYGSVLVPRARDTSLGVPNLKIYNNVFVGGFALGHLGDNWRSFLEENNNIFWAIGDTSYSGLLDEHELGSSSRVICGPSSCDEDYFEGSGNFFNF